MGPLKLSDESVPTRGVVDLDHPASGEVRVVGAKAAALATARRAGLPVLDGFVLSTWAAARWRLGGPSPELERDLRAAWCGLTDGGPVVVRSSSPNEDTASSSMAGQFRSVLDVRSWDELVQAVHDVVDSADGGPMAVLVQPFVQPAWGGVLFGADPVTGRQDRLVVAAVPGGPHRLVSGTVSGSQFSLSHRGRVIESTGAVPGALLTRRARRGLGRLAHRTADVFGGPQDLEWAIQHDGRLVLLQSRPITTLGPDVVGDVSGPVLGPGPVAETFPVALSPLEEELWIPPLRDGLRHALALVATAPARRLRSSPLVVTVAGRPAVDLELLGLSPVRRSFLSRFDPRPPARRLVAAWRVGRLRAALPALALDLLDEVDDRLRAVPDLDTLSPGQLVRLLERSAGVLTSLHGYEVLAGQLLATDTTAPTAASRALAVLAETRTEQPHRSDAELMAEHPVLLSLHPPAIGPGAPLPPTPTSAPVAATSPGSVDPATTRREALRLRVRWVHELTARAAWRLGEELAGRGVLADPAQVRHLPLDELRRAVAGQAVAAPAQPTSSGRETPLPRAFRLAGDVIVPVAATEGRGNAGRGAGGGRGVGRVHSGDGVPSRGAVLVVATLDPGLAALLPGLGGLVAETGSVLSHLAILAREYGVPTVVDLPGARQRFPAGSWVVVDGSSGEVATVESEEWEAA